MKRTGIFYVVATPIGNLADITLRAERALKEVSLIACEDTRVTQKLLNHLGLSTPLLRADETAIPQAVERVLAELSAGRDVALVSDAGTPGLSDPGARLISPVVGAGFEVIPVPGASALSSALSVCHFPTLPLLFLGFLPKKKGERDRMWAEAGEISVALGFFLPARDLPKMLPELAESLGVGRQALIAREMSKVHEEYLRGTLAELAERAGGREFKGEATMIVAAPLGGGKGELPSVKELQKSLREMLAGGLTKKEAYLALAKRFGVAKREVYNLLEVR